ncbi:MAG: ABC transporter permease [Actinomycetaceae bacterium]|nr:ABC transporter permease [Actinomycetaceae bacterium]
MRAAKVFDLLILAAVAVIVTVALAPHWFTSYDPLALNLPDAFAPPGPAHPLGADESGRDVFARIVYGARDSLTIGVAATALGMIPAIILGTISALSPPLLDAAIVRALEALYAIPLLLLALLVITIVGPGKGPAILAVGLSVAPGYARIVRSQVMSLRRSEMVDAAVVDGLARWRIVTRHLLPNALRPLLALVTLGVGQAVIWASALSFLGLGTLPPAPEWGAMLAAGRIYISTAWWLTVFPGLAVVATAMVATIAGRRLSGQVRAL